jgi:hypothetical protein
MRPGMTCYPWTRLQYLFILVFRNNHDNRIKYWSRKISIIMFMIRKDIYLVAVSPHTNTRHGNTTNNDQEWKWSSRKIQKSPIWTLFIHEQVLFRLKMSKNILKAFRIEVNDRRSQKLSWTEHCSVAMLRYRGVREWEGMTPIIIRVLTVMLPSHCLYKGIKPYDLALSSTWHNHHILICHIQVSNWHRGNDVYISTNQPHTQGPRTLVLIGHSLLRKFHFIFSNIKAKTFTFYFRESKTFYSKANNLFPKIFFLAIISSCEITTWRSGLTIHLFLKVRVRKSQVS